jgi:hypothetical protein
LVKAPTFKFLTCHARQFAHTATIRIARQEAIPAGLTPQSRLSDPFMDLPAPVL